MEKLEAYLDRVCRGVGGPRSLRQHLRQELGEHLRDAVAKYQATGLPEDEARARALADFGGPDEVRSELEAAHGQRVLAVLIDKALEWKEATMKAKWLWASWAYLACVGVLALAVLWITFANMFLVPKFQKLAHDGIIDVAMLDETQVSWMPRFLERVHNAGDHSTLLLLLAAGAWGLFEFQVRGENKPFMRIAALGTAAAGLLAVGVLMAGSLVIPYMLSAPSVGKLVAPAARQQLAAIDTSVRALEQDKAMIGPGSSTAWHVRVDRLNGFAGPVKVEVTGLPAGVSASPLAIQPAMKEGIVVLTAAADAQRDTAVVQVVGSATMTRDGHSETVTHPATPVQEIYVPGGGRGRFDVGLQAVAVTGPSDILKVDVKPAAVTLKPGEEVRLDVTLQRRADYDKDVTIDVVLSHLGGVFGNPLPPGVTVVEGKSKTAIRPGANQGHIVLKAASDAAPIENVPICVLAHVSINFVVKVSYSSPPLPLAVRR